MRDWQHNNNTHRLHVLTTDILANKNTMMQPTATPPIVMQPTAIYPLADPSDVASPAIQSPKAPYPAPSATIAPSALPIMEASPVEDSQSAEGHEGGIFSDERGNLRMVNFVVTRPWCSCCSVLLTCLVMIVLLGIIVSSDGSIITQDKNAYDLYDVRSKAYDSYRLAKEAVEENRDATENAGLVEPRQSETLDIVYWIYEAETDGGMFTKKALQDMKKADDIMLQHKWQDHCVLEHFNEDGTPKPASEVTCKKPMSPTTIFFPESWDSALASSVVDRLKQQATVDLYNRLAPCLEHGALCDTVMQGVTAEQQAAALQLKLDIEAITSKWTGTGDLIEDPKEAVLLCAYLKLLPTKAFEVDFYFDKNFSVENPVSMFSRSLLEFGGPIAGYNRTEDKKSDQVKDIKDYVLDYLYDDMEAVAKKSASPDTNTFYFMGSLIFDVIVKILFADALKAIAAVLMVFLYLWYMLGSLFLASVGMAEILLSLPCAWFLYRGVFQIQYFGGTNALTIFIVCAIGADDIFVFMDAYRLSAHKGPEVNRDLATRMTWVWRKAGRAMAITSATTCMAFLCVLFTPVAPARSFGIFAALAILTDYLLVMSFFCTAVVIYHNRFEREPACQIPGLCGCCTAGCECGNQDPTPTEHALSSFHDGVDVPQDKVTRFFSTSFADFILSVKGRLLILLVLIAWLVPAIVFVTKLEPTKTAEQFLDENHPLQYSITILQNEFPVSAHTEGLSVFFTWGVDTLDQSGVNQLTDPGNVGEAVFKEHFEFNPACQRKIAQACDDLKFTRSEERTALLKREDTGFSVVRCVMDSFVPFADAKGFTAAGSNDTVPLANVNDAIKAFRADPPLGVEDIDSIVDNFGWDGERLRYVSIEVESQELDQWTEKAEEVTRAQYEGFMRLAEHLDEIVGDSCGARGVVMTDLEQKFIFMNNQRIYRNGAISGSAIGVSMAFVVILLATWSPLLAVLATISILSTIMSVIGAVVMMGWTLGTMESILISILAGFSVDYVVHLAHAFAESKGSAHQRVRHAFAEMGTPVLSGMLTSVLASLPLFACQIVFFEKFGTFLCFTILCSWVFANFGFMAAIATVGCSSNDTLTVSLSESESGDQAIPKGPGVELTSRPNVHAQAVYTTSNPV